MTESHPASYSSDTRLRLVVGHKWYGLLKAQSDRVYLMLGVSLPRGKATVVVFVDGERREWSVKILRDTVPFDNEVAIAIL